MSGSGEKTEQPTSKKLREAREKGQVAMSKDVVSTALLIALLAWFGIGWRWNSERLTQLVMLPADYLTLEFEQALPGVLQGVLSICLQLSLPPLAISIAVGIFANVVQTGPLLAFEPIKPELKKIDPVAKLKQIFSMKNLFEFVKSSLKVVFLTVLLYFLIRDAIDPLVHAPFSGMSGMGAITTALMWKLALYTCLAYVIVAVADFVFQRFQHTKGLMMTKDEVKREYKEMEGDPTIKGRRKQLHQEMAMNDAGERVKKASVVVTNPTHLAIALYYKPGETKLPIVLAKGDDYIARRMREVARQEGIPIMRNVPLARALWQSTPVEQYIPSDLIEPVAEVLRWVKQITDDPAAEREAEASWNPEQTSCEFLPGANRSLG